MNTNMPSSNKENKIEYICEYCSSRNIYHFNQINHDSYGLRTIKCFSCGAPIKENSLNNKESSHSKEQLNNDYDYLANFFKKSFDLKSSVSFREYILSIRAVFILFIIVFLIINLSLFILEQFLCMIYMSMCFSWAGNAIFPILFIICTFFVIPLISLNIRLMISSKRQ